MNHQHTLIPSKPKPKLAYLGVGWVGRNRMEAIIKQNICETIAIADPSEQCSIAALQLAPKAKLASSLDELLNIGADGIIIATPSALHAEQSIAALRKGLAVFSQKPLARTAQETQQVVTEAHKANQLLGVDFSYRYTEAMKQVSQLVQSGRLGEIYAVNLVYHSAYGPSKPWFYDPALSGGGCVMDLGIHLIDLALWTLRFPEVVNVTSRLFAGGVLLKTPFKKAEDFGVATFGLASGTTIQLSCSWNLSAGQDARIEATFYGTKGTVAFKNVKGSFYNFSAEQYFGTQRKSLSHPPDEWSGRAAVDWARRLVRGEKFNRDADNFIKVSQVIDQIYGRL